MMPRLSLAYLVFEVRKPAQWNAFFQSMLGLPAPLKHADGSTGWRTDNAAQRLLLQQGPRDDLAAAGWECADTETLSGLVARLRAAGHVVRPASDAEREQRRVQQLWQLEDPQGTSVELCVGLEPAQQPFASDAFPDGFRTGALGLGHVVLVTDDLPAMEHFYGDLLGFSVTERLKTKVGPIDIQGTFMHCNRRHHSLALFDMPSPKRLHHFMLQAQSMRDVGRAHDRARALKLPLNLGLGQHPAPDNTFSFYGDTPSGFEFEIGACTEEIEPAGWRTMHTSSTSAWGHAPQLHLKRKMLRAVLSRLFRRRSIHASQRQIMGAEA